MFFLLLYYFRQKLLFLFYNKQTSCYDFFLHFTVFMSSMPQIPQKLNCGFFCVCLCQLVTMKSTLIYLSVLCSVVNKTVLQTLSNLPTTGFNVSVHFSKQRQKSKYTAWYENRVIRLLPTLIIMTGFGFILLTDCIKGLPSLGLFQLLISV